MNKREALEACEAHWLWLAEDPWRKKRDYVPSQGWKGHCACCEHDRQHGRLAYQCAYCPIPSEMWSVASPAEEDPFFWPCKQPDSPYATWQAACPGSPERAAAAHTVAALARRALDELEEADDE